MAGDQNRADGDLVAHDRLHQLLRGRARIAITEDNDVFEISGRFFQRFLGDLQDVLKASQVALVHACNLPLQILFVAYLLQGKQPALAAVPQRHTHFISRPERCQHALRAITRHLVAVGEFHPMHHQHDCATGQNFFAVQLHVYGQRRFQRCAAIAAGGVGLVAPNANQADSKVAHRAFEQLLTIRSQISRRQIADEDRIIALHFGQSAGEFINSHQADLQPGSLKGRSQLLVRLGISRDDEDARFPAHSGKSAGAVVLRQWIARSIDPTVVAVKTRLRQSLRESEQVFAGGKFDRLLAQILFVTIQTHDCFLRLVRLHEDFYIENLPLFQFRGHLHFLDGHIVGPRHAHGHYVHRDPQRFGGEHSAHRVANVFIAIRHQHQALLAILREGRRPEPDRRRQIRALGSHDRLNFLQVNCGVGRRLNAGFVAEDNYARLIDILFLLRSFVNVITREVLLR